MIQAADDAQSTIVPILEAAASAGGPSTLEARASLLAEFEKRLHEQAPAIEGLILVLSGCMLEEDGHSIDEAVVRAARETLEPGSPIIVVWSTLANLSEELLSLTDLSLSYDPRETEAAKQVGIRAVDLVQRLGRREIRTQVEFRKLPLLLPPGTWRGDQEPARTIEALAREFEAQSGVYAVSICTGFPFADQASSGASIVVAADAELGSASGLATRLRTAIWTNRDAFFTEPVNVEIAVHAAMLATAPPVVIADAGDDPALGAASEGNGLLWALIDLGTRNAALAAIVDPSAIEAAISAGVGNTIMFDLGGKTDRSAGYPIEVTARVRRILGAGRLTSGRTAWLDVEGRHGGGIEVVISEQPVEPTPELFQALGIDLASKQIIGLKSTWRINKTFGDVATTIIRATTPGITTPVLAFFDFQHMPRPIYPLDAL